MGGKGLGSISSVCELYLTGDIQHLPLYSIDTVDKVNTYTQIDSTKSNKNYFFNTFMTPNLSSTISVLYNMKLVLRSS